MYFITMYKFCINRKKKEKTVLKAVSTTVLGLFESYDYREDNQREINK